ncbi:hypothetical protein, partial [Pantoea ananatis]|uniref:hypothetical protein n=1 Tax=Pantoea ananas TaxID=553 RepID=UPI001B3120BD
SSMKVVKSDFQQVVRIYARNLCRSISSLLASLAVIWGVFPTHLLIDHLEFIIGEGPARKGAAVTFCSCFNKGIAHYANGVAQPIMWFSINLDRKGKML